MTKSFKQFLYKVVHLAFLIIFVFFLMLFYSSYVPHTKTKLNLIPGKSPSFLPLPPALTVPAPSLLIF